MDKICPNCTQVIQNKYCSQCGTLLTGKRLDINDMVSSSLESIFNLDNALLRTFVKLTKDPYVVVQQYWNGYKKYYMNPFRLFMISILFVGLRIYWKCNNLFFFSIGTEMNIGQEWIALGSRIIIFSLLSMIVFRKINPSFIEHLVATIYVISFVSIIELPLALIVKWLEGFTWLQAIIQFTFTLYIFYSLTKSYRPATDTKGIRKGMLFYLGILFIFLGTLGFILFAYKSVQ